MMATTEDELRRLGLGAAFNAYTANKPTGT